MKDETLVEAIKTDYTDAKISDADRAMLDWSDKLARTPSAMTEDDIKTLRGHGFSDRAIHDMAVVGAYFAFVNRVAEGLGVTLEKPTS